MKLPAVAALAAAALAVLGCGDFYEVGSLYADISAPYTTVEASGASPMTLSINTTSSWTLTIKYKGTSEGWASTSVSSGNALVKKVLFIFENNTSSSQRSCVLVLKSGDKESSLEIVQRPKNSYNLKAESQPRWMELPAMTDGSDYFFHHDMTVGSKQTRNYSFYLNPEAKLSEWVAYPLNKGLIGANTGRSNNWALDPKVPAAYQSAISSPYKGGYERGHQIPSADRYADGANEATFYGTNITPQKPGLNGNAWASLEGFVRDWSYKLDTLYVVTGVDLSGSTSYATDNDGKKIKVPTGYYKVLLGYKRSKNIGITATTGGYTAIAFYFRHATTYEDEIPGCAMTVDALEEKLNMDFFPLLSTPIGIGKGGVGPTLSAKVESTMDSWWLKQLNL